MEPQACQDMLKSDWLKNITFNQVKYLLPELI